MSEEGSAGALAALRFGAFVCLSAVAMIAALVAFVLSVFWNLVVPPILGPLLQGAATVLVVGGIQLLLQGREDRSQPYAVASVLLVLVGQIIAAKAFKVSAVGLVGYAVAAVPTGLCALAISMLAHRAVNRLGRISRVLAGILLVACGLVVPAVLAGCFSKDLL